MRTARYLVLALISSPAAAGCGNVGPSASGPLTEDAEGMVEASDVNGDPAETTTASDPPDDGTSPPEATSGGSTSAANSTTDEASVSAGGPTSGDLGGSGDATGVGDSTASNPGDPTATEVGDTTGGPEVPLADWPQINGVQWADTDGNPIQAHGGGVLKVGADYYWFGENRNPDGTFFAVSAYRSQDLKQWEFRHHVLQSSSDPDLAPANVERPKVVYNDVTGTYVMWMHWENGRDYGEARAAVASSDTVDGDYTYHGSFRPFAESGITDHGKPGYMSRDCTLFVDDDGTGYFLSTTNENYDLNLYRLTDDYLQVDDLVATLFVGGHREAPALFKRNGVYFLLTSGSTGWNPNQAQYATSSNLASGWSSMRNVADGNTFHSQSAFVLEVTGGGETNYLYMGDRWAGAYSGRVNDSTYIWQPIAFPENDQMSMSWTNTLNLDGRQGQVQGSVERFVIVNKRSGLALDIEGSSSENGADIIQMPAAGRESQHWSLNYNGRGHFRLTNVMSDKVLDVPDESTSDGAELIQWDDHDGDNQGWLLMDVGRGEYLLRNQRSEKYVAVVDASMDEGAAVEQRSPSGGDEQLWTIVVAD